MVRWNLALSLGLLLLGAGTASAWDREAAQLRVTAGVNAKVSQYDYSSGARLANAARIIGVGASIRLRPFISATVDFDHTFFGGSLGPAAWAPELTPSADASSMTTALLGFELQAPTRDGHGPYLSAAVGAGRLSIGGIHVADMNGGGVSYPATRDGGPAFALGAGFRTPRVFGGPSVQLGMRSVSMLTGHRWQGILPFTASLVY